MFAKALARVVDEETSARSEESQTAGRERIERHDTGLSWPSQFARLASRPSFHPEPELTIASLLIGLGGAWIIIENSRLRSRLAEALREGETQRLRAQTQGKIADMEAQYRRLDEEREQLQGQLQAAKEKASLTTHAAPVLFALSIESVQGVRRTGTSADDHSARR